MRLIKSYEELEKIPYGNFIVLKDTKKGIVYSIRKITDRNYSVNNNKFISVSTKLYALTKDYVENNYFDYLKDIINLKDIIKEKFDEEKSFGGNNYTFKDDLINIYEITFDELENFSLLKSSDEVISYIKGMKK